MHQDTCILLLAQQLADTDLEQVFNPCFLRFVHSGPGWSLPLLMLPSASCNPAFMQHIKTSCKYTGGIIHTSQRETLLRAHGGRICASFTNCCCSSVTQEPPMMLCLASTVRTGLHQLYSGQITILLLQTKWKRRAW